MGSNCHIYISGFPIYEMGDWVFPEIMSLYRDADKNTYKRMLSQRNPFVWGYLIEEGEEDVEETAFEYIQTVRTLKTRLNIMGFSLNRIKEGYPSFIADQLDHIERIQEVLHTGRITDYREGEIEKYAEYAKIVSQSKLEEWLAAVSKIKQERLFPDRRRENFIKDRSLIGYIYDRRIDYLLECFTFPDIRSDLRALLEVFDDEELVTLDYTELVVEGYYAPSDMLCEVSQNELIGDYPINSKIIVLTEGSTDKRVIEESLAILYPELKDYYSFIDFNVANSPGGASTLVTIIKAFIGSGIANRVVALLDNDTAASVALKGLSGVKVPGNIKIIQYPHLELATCYPTLGPGGISELDVNGLAGSIELYFGKDILTRNGKLVPVQWRGFDSSLGKYQGEILEKRLLQDAFFEKLTKCAQNPELVSSMDWESMRLILTEIFDAFA